MFPLGADDDGFLGPGHHFLRPSSGRLFDFNLSSSLTIYSLFLPLTLALGWLFGLLLEPIGSFPKSATAVLGSTVTGLLTDTREPAFDVKVLVSIGIGNAR